MTRLLLVALLFVPLGQLFADPVRVSEIGVIGDSGITGALADPSVKLNLSWLSLKMGGFLLGPGIESSIFAQLFKIEDPSTPRPEVSEYGSAFAEFGLPDDLRPPLRAYFSEAEIAPDRKNLVHLNLNRRGSMKIDLLQYSSPYLLSSALGVGFDHLIYVAQDGQKTSSIEKQVERFSSVPEIKERGYLPDLLIVSFTANDFCSEDIWGQKLIEIRRSYRKTLRTQLSKIRQKFRASPEGTHVVYMAPLNVLQIFESEDILSKRVRFMDTTVTCKDLRDHSSAMSADPLRKQAFKSLIGMCPSVLNTTRAQKDRVNRLKRIFDGVVKIQSEVIAELNQEPQDGWTFSHFTKSYEQKLDGDDVANDCFHPSLGAHIKLARELLTHLEGLQQVSH